MTHGEETRGILAIGGQAARNEFQQLLWRQHTIAKNSCVTHGEETRGSLAIGGQAARNEFQQCPWRQHTIVKIEEILPRISGVIGQRHLSTLMRYP